LKKNADFSLRPLCGTVRDVKMALMATHTNHNATAAREDTLKAVNEMTTAPPQDFRDCGDAESSACFPHREREKKGNRNVRETSASQGAGLPADTLAAFHERLRDLCRHDSACHGPDREARIHAQAQHTLALAGELGCLKETGVSWAGFLALCPDAIVGTEHMVELDPRAGLVGKTTIPPAFGLVPEVRSHSLAVLRQDEGAPCQREVIEFVPATPLEYLARWLASNEVFGDDVRLASVIHWSDGMVSFGITQPQYHGAPAEPREIDVFFKEAGWTRLNDPSGHTVFFNYAFGVLAIDAERRNCYLNQGGLQPFDVILCVPDEALERYLSIY
jgi:hypothetical protein